MHHPDERARQWGLAGCGARRLGVALVTAAAVLAAPLMGAAAAETAPAQTSQPQPAGGMPDEVTVTMTVDAEEGSEAMESAIFLRDFLSQVFATTSDASLNEDDRMVAFRRLVSEGLAIDYIGLRMLGKYRETASEEDLAAYREVFPDYITSLYAAQLSQLSKVNMRITRTRDFGASRGVLVRSLLQRRNGDPINIDWHIAKNTKGERRIIDISVEGVSIMLTKQDEFAELIDDQGLPALVAELRSRSQTGNLKVL